MMELTKRERGIFLGDSFIFGYGVELNDSFVEILEKISGIDVVNMGVDSYSSLNNYYMLENYGINLSPKYVFWGLFQNDFVGSDGTQKWRSSNKSFSDFEKAASKGDINAPFYKIRHFLTKNSAIYNLVKIVFKKENFIKKNKQIYDKEADLFFRVDYLEEMTDLKNPSYQIGLNLTKDVLLKSEKLAESINASFIIVIIPSKEQTYDFLLKKMINQTKLNQSIETITDFCLNNNLNCINLLPQLECAAKKGERIYFKTDGHLTASGNKIVAESINKEIKKFKTKKSQAKRNFL